MVRQKKNDSKDRYLVINNDNHINKESIIFFCLWDSIINKIKYLRGADVFIPNDVLLRFYSLVIVINYVIEKNDEFIPEIYINEGYFTKV